MRQRQSEGALGRCFVSDYTQFEIVLVDDGSTDSTLVEMKKFSGQNGVKIISKKNGGKAHQKKKRQLASEDLILKWIV